MGAMPCLSTQFAASQASPSSSVLNLLQSTVSYVLCSERRWCIMAPSEREDAMRAATHRRRHQVCTTSARRPSHAHKPFISRAHHDAPPLQLARALTPPFNMSQKVSIVDPKAASSTTAPTTM